MEHELFEHRMRLLAERVGGMNKIANDIGVHPNTLYRVQSGSGYPSIPVIVRIAKEYHVNLNWLLGVVDDRMFLQ